MENDNFTSYYKKCCCSMLSEISLGRKYVVLRRTIGSEKSLV
jgi:hypothetical protein